MYHYVSLPYMYIFYFLFISELELTKYVYLRNKYCLAYYISETDNRYI